MNFLFKKQVTMATLWVVNSTATTLKMTDVHSSHMNVWSFSDVPANSKQKFPISFDSDPTNATAQTTYTLEGASTTFQLQAHYYGDSRGRQLSVDWSGMDNREFTLFPPPISGSTTATIGWIDNGALCVYIHTKPTPLPSHPQLAMLGTQWMKYYEDAIGSLTLSEMCIPGTHDSGTYQPQFILGREWIRTESLSLRNQLDMGIRSLDLRIGQNSPGDYIISHDVWKTSYSLSKALGEVLDFVKATQKDIVILDFHRFNDLSSGKYQFDYEQLKAQVKGLLAGYYVPGPEGIGRTLSQLWARPEAVKERVIITWNDGSIDNSYMWPGVNQHWYSEADTQDKLFNAISVDFSHPPGRDKMWGACVFKASSALHPPLRNAQDIKGTIDSWFYGCADWTLKANIIMTDFCPDYNNVIQAAICATLINGSQKQRC